MCVTKNVSNPIITKGNFSPEFEKTSLLHGNQPGVIKSTQNSLCWQFLTWLTRLADFFLSEKKTNICGGKSAIIHFFRWHPTDFDRFLIIEHYWEEKKAGFFNMKTFKLFCFWYVFFGSITTNHCMSHVKNCFRDYFQFWTGWSTPKTRNQKLNPKRLRYQTNKASWASQC